MESPALEPELVRSTYLDLKLKKCYNKKFRFYIKGNHSQKPARKIFNPIEF